MNEEKKEKRGGRREGAGRPKGNNKLYAFRADKDVADFIDAHDNKTEFIRDCILQADKRLLRKRRLMLWAK